MNIKGIQKTSLIDFPGKICSIIFTGGCNLRCKYCHNPELACNSKELESYSKEQVLHLLKSRQGLIDGVTITGGEATLSEDLESFIQLVKNIALSVKIDTNGLRPEVIERLIKKDIVDYFAIDIKTSPQKYELLVGKRIDFSTIMKSLEIIRDSTIDYELRTTCIPYYVTFEDFKSIKRIIGPVKRYYLQQFSNSITLDSSLRRYEPYPPSVLNEFQYFVRSFADICEIRGV